PCARWVCISVAGAPTQLGRDVAFAVRSAVWLAQHRAEIDAVLANGCVTLAPSDINAVHFVHGAWLCSPHYPYRAGGGVYALYQQLYTRLNARWERGAFRRARAVVAVSEQVRAELLSIGVPAQRIRVI